MPEKSNVKKAMDNIRTHISDEARGLSPAEYRELLEELLAEAEGWKMTLDEEDSDE